MGTTRGSSWILLYFQELLFWGIVTSMAIDTEKPFSKMARCRVQCIKKFMDPNGIRRNDDNTCWETNNNVNRPKTECEDCWFNCKEMIASSSYLRIFCADNRCQDGCKAACHFVRNAPKIQASTCRADWTFNNTVKSSTTAQEVIIEWSPPVSSNLKVQAEKGCQSSVTNPNDAAPFVYVLQSRNKNKPRDGWRVVAQLGSHKIRVSTQVIPSAPEFLLSAVSDNGVVTQEIFQSKSLVFGAFDDPSGLKLATLLESEENGWYLDPSPPNLSVENSEKMNASLRMYTETAPVEDSLGEIFHHGLQKAELRFKGPSWLPSNVRHAYTIRWFFLTCDNSVYRYLPDCDEARDNWATTVYALPGEEASYVINNLKYNSLYQAVIYLSHEFTVRTKLVFKTSRCYQPDPVHLNFCDDPVPIDKRSDVPVLIPEQPDYEPPVLRLAVNVTSMVREPGTSHVKVNVTWSPVVLNQTSAWYNVTTFAEADGAYVAMMVTSHPYIVLSLKQNTLYRIQISADVDEDAVEPLHFFDELEFNTSDVDLPMYQRPQAMQMKKKSQATIVGDVMITISCFGGLAFLSILLLILYRKRKNFKGIIDSKATVAKSNSYKSNVGGKSDYSNQLVMISDEWEMDPTLLKFSTLLGQGAFGKVVTGYYEDQKVAIKLVREGAPASYKEDLVTEVNLMKRLGSHPNIVCLIGACTLGDPIALVMEYVPYGNLHNFLKKCRMEGDLRKRSDGPSELTYTVVQECGNMESGVVTPADMLSFARQVAMAMEYLTEKKYVHRDLAARNVLLDYNKVVKVCDFGLSRDVFQDNHYRTLTNGKLPIKWMAIESLRERMFTTHSDVWSFGILLWEIVTMGASPYPHVALADLYYVLSSGYRMDRPSNCSHQLYDIMKKCWEEEPSSRPDFTELRFMLEDLLTEDRDYLVLEDIDVPISNNENSSSPTTPTLIPEQELIDADSSKALVVSKHMSRNVDFDDKISFLPSPDPPTLSPLSMLSQHSYPTSPRMSIPCSSTSQLETPSSAKMTITTALTPNTKQHSPSPMPITSPVSPLTQQQKTRRQHFFGPDDDSIRVASPSTTVIDHRRRSANMSTPHTPVSNSPGAVLTTFSPIPRLTSTANTSAASTSFTLKSPPVKLLKQPVLTTFGVTPSVSNMEYEHSLNLSSLPVTGKYSSASQNRKSIGNFSNCSADTCTTSCTSREASSSNTSPTSLFPPSFNLMPHSPCRSLSSSSSTSSTSELVPNTSVGSTAVKQPSSGKPGTIGPMSTKYVKKMSPRRDNMRINVCVNQNSTDRLFRPSESDSSPSSC